MYVNSIRRYSFHPCLESLCGCTRIVFKHEVCTGEFNKRPPKVSMSRCLLQSTSITVHVICIPGRSHDSVAVFPTLISNTTVWWSDCSSYFILIYTKLSIQPLFVLIILGIWMVVRFSVENQYMKSVYLFRIDLKMDFRSKKLFLHIHLYFLATQYLWKYALVADIDNWTRCYILIIMNWNRQK